MPNQKKKRQSPPRPLPSGEAGHPRPLKRRMPRPRPVAPPTPVPVLPRTAQDPPHPQAGELAQQIRHICQVGQLDPFVVFHDWVGMLEASLVYQAENAKAMALTGRFIEDPPPVKEHYRRARERYLRASEKYPATYRLMQTGFATVFAELELFAGPGLEWYAQQTALNPDLVGQIFLELLRPAAEWRQYFPAWGDALTAAQRLYPNAAEIAYEALIKVAATRQFQNPSFIRLEPGINFEAWLEAVEEQFEPILIGPASITSSAMMLAIAVQFPAWMVRRGLVKFVWTGVDPLLQQMANINICLYGLNGYELKLWQAVKEISAGLEEEERQPGLQRRALSPSPPLPAELASTETGQRQPVIDRLDQVPDRTFESLFRRGREP